MLAEVSSAGRSKSNDASIKEGGGGREGGGKGEMTVGTTRLSVSSAND